MDTKKRFLDHIERSKVHLQRGLAIHQVVNAILNQKYRSMQEKHIAVILKVGDLQEICLEEEEIVILLSNLLDNAIRESEKVLKNTGKAVIHLKLECEAILCTIKSE